MKRSRRTRSRSNRVPLTSRVSDINVRHETLFAIDAMTRLTVYGVPTF